MIHRTTVTRTTARDTRYKCACGVAGLWLPNDPQLCIRVSHAHLEPKPEPTAPLLPTRSKLGEWT